MKIKYVRMKNIRSYTDEQIMFPSGSTLLSGDIGSGKTTILLSIDFALFGARRGELNASELLRNGSNEGFVELLIDIYGVDVSIKRTLKRKKSIAQEEGTIEIGGVCTDYTPTELNAKINDFIGYPEKNNSTIYRFSVYTPQEEMKVILIDKEKRIQILRKIFGIDKYGIIKENTKLVLSEMRAEKRLYDEQSKNIQEKTDELRLEENKKKYMGIQLEEKEMFIKEIDKNIEETKESMLLVRKAIENNKEIEMEVAKKQSEYNQKKMSLKKIESDLVKNKINLSEIEKKMVFYREYKKPEAIKIDIYALETEKDGIIRHSSFLNKDVENLKDTLAKGICSHCGQAVHNALAFELNLRTKEEELKRKILELQNVSEKLIVAKKNIDENNRYAILEEKHKSLKKEYDKEKSLEQNNSKEREGLIIELEEIEKYISKLLSRIDTSQKDKYEQIEKEIQKLNVKRIENESLRSRTEQQIKGIEDNICKINMEITKKKVMKENSLKLSNYINFIEDYFLNLMSNIEKHVMILLQKEFDSIFKEYFSFFISDINVRIDEEFTPIVEQNSYDTSYENLSGGEKTSIALAYRLALNTIINNMIDSIKTKDILILDEPTDGFSSEQLDKLRDVLTRLKSKQTIIVSHEQKIDAFVDNVIKIQKNGHVSSIINQ